MAAKEEGDVNMETDAVSETPQKEPPKQRLFTLKKWNAVAMWSWDVECDTCAICRVQVMGKSSDDQSLHVMCLGETESENANRRITRTMH